MLAVHVTDVGHGPVRALKRGAALLREDRDNGRGLSPAQGRVAVETRARGADIAGVSRRSGPMGTDLPYRSKCLLPKVSAPIGAGRLKSQQLFPPGPAPPARTGGIPMRRPGSGAGGMMRPSSPSGSPWLPAKSASRAWRSRPCPARAGSRSGAGLRRLLRRLARPAKRRSAAVRAMIVCGDTDGQSWRLPLGLHATR